MDEKFKTPATIYLIGIILLLLESIGDIIFRDFFINLDAFGSPVGEAYWTFMTLMSFASLAFFTIILVIGYKKGFNFKHFLAVLIVAVISLLMASAFYSLIVIIVAAGVGMSAAKKKS